MRLEVDPGPLPKGRWTNLTAALTWLRFDRALDLRDLLSQATRQGFSEGDVQGALNDEWHGLRDYACEGKVGIRARKSEIVPEVELGEDQLRNCPYIIWFDGEDNVRIDPFDFGFSGGFKSRIAEDLRGFQDPVVGRKGLVSYKRVRARRRVGIDRVAAWRAAARWLEAWLRKQEPMPGWKLPVVKHMVAKFGITKSRAQELWTDTASKLKWPLRGAPNKLQKEKLRSILSNARVFE